VVGISSGFEILETSVHSKCPSMVRGTSHHMKKQTMFGDPRDRNYGNFGALSHQVARRGWQLAAFYVLFSTAGRPGEIRIGEM